MRNDSYHNTLVSEDFCSDYYYDEPIVHRLSKEILPEPLRIIRSMENTRCNGNLAWQRLFLKQALLLADYEDDYEYNKEVVRYYPTYQSLSDRELRAYFSWRTKWRKGNLQKCSLSFAFIYIYELLHLVGCSSTQNAYDKLQAFARDYAGFDPKVTPYLEKWLVDFVVYYGLDPKLLVDREEIQRDHALSTLMALQTKNDDEVFQAVLKLSGSALTRSRFYNGHQKMMKNVVVNTLRRVAAHYTQKCKKVWIEDYFGSFLKEPVTLFKRAVFCDHYQNVMTKVELSPIRYYDHTKGYWVLYCCEYNSLCHKRFLDLLRTIDSLLRKATNFPHLTDPKIKTKWILSVINENIRKWQESEQQAKREKLNLDLSQLETIRSDAIETQEKLITEEEIEEASELTSERTSNIISCSESFESLITNSVPNDNSGFSALSPQEKRYLQCLLSGTSTSWVNDEGLLPSLLCDGINEKLYNVFADTVLENGEIVEDYREELKKGLFV